MAEASSETSTAVGDEKQSSSLDHQSCSNKVDSTTPPNNNNTTADDSNNESGGVGDDDMLLVTEFPPPPYYYSLATQSKLIPPPIPTRAFKVAAKRVMMERQKAKEESDRIRLDAEELSKGSSSGGGGGGAVKGEGNNSSKDETKIDSTTVSTKQDNDDTSTTGSIDPNEQVVAVFGEIVEDPTLVKADDECNDPVDIRENVKRLNQDVLNGFLKLLKQLVHAPNDNKKLRDELSHNLFLMLQECNKFREHQAREILISTLEQQLDRRQEGLKSLKKQIDQADKGLQKFRET